LKDMIRPNVIRHLQEQCEASPRYSRTDRIASFFGPSGFKRNPVR
jgi:hypothetical protein